MDQPQLAAHQFGTAASAYLSSDVHAAGADLDRLTALAASHPQFATLDLGCGAGHASFALARGGAAHVVAYDLATPMLDVVTVEARRRGHVQIETCRGPAEALPFADASFGRVVSRFSAHHWLNVGRAVQEMARVLVPGGHLIIIDVIAPENPLFDTVLQTVELLRDASHVRDYRESEWRDLLQRVGFELGNVNRWRLPMEFTSWTARIRTPPARVAALQATFDDLPGEARTYFEVTPTHSFVIDAGWMESRYRPQG